MLLFDYLLFEYLQRKCQFCDSLKLTPTTHLVWRNHSFSKSTLNSRPYLNFQKKNLRLLPSGEKCFYTVVTSLSAFNIFFECAIKMLSIFIATQVFGPKCHDSNEKCVLTLTEWISETGKCHRQAISKCVAFNWEKFEYAAKISLLPFS